MTTPTPLLDRLRRVLELADEAAELRRFADEDDPAADPRPGDLNRAEADRLEAEAEDELRALIREAVGE